MASLQDQIRSFLEKNNNDGELILRILYGCKTCEDVTDEVASRFIMDCITSGFEDLVDRAIQLYKEGSE